MQEMYIEEQEVQKDERQKSPSTRTKNPVRSLILTNDIAASKLIKIKKKGKLVSPLFCLLFLDCCSMMHFSPFNSLFKQNFYFRLQYINVKEK